MRERTPRRRRPGLGGLPCRWPAPGLELSPDGRGRIAEEAGSRLTSNRCLMIDRKVDALNTWRPGHQVLQGDSLGGPGEVVRSGARPFGSKPHLPCGQAGERSSGHSGPDQPAAAGVWVLLVRRAEVMARLACTSSSFGHSSQNRQILHETRSTVRTTRSDDRRRHAGWRARLVLRR